MSKYKCPECNKIVERDSDKQWIKSWCQKENKEVRLRLDSKTRIIKFSHKYSKLEDSVNHTYTSKSILLDVVIVNLKDLSKDFLDYDTDKGLFELPKTGKYMLLIFRKACTNNLFTTLRIWSKENESRYRSGIGMWFDIEFKQEG